MARNLRHCARALAIVRAALVRKNANALLMLCFARFYSLVSKLYFDTKHGEPTGIHLYKNWISFGGNLVEHKHLCCNCYSNELRISCY